MPTRCAKASWEGDIKNGWGTMRSQSGAVDGAYSFASRFEDGRGSNPEELIAAAHAGCFAMALSLMLGEAGHEIEGIDAQAAVTIRQVDGEPTITDSRLDVTARVKGIEEAEFRRIAEEAKAGCPVSRALAGVEITLEARLAG
jgi:osmotically inducible protein OsmC